MQTKILWIAIGMFLSAFVSAIVSKTLQSATATDSKGDEVEVFYREAISTRQIHLVDDNGFPRILLTAITDNPGIHLFGRKGPVASWTVATSDDVAEMAFWYETDSGLKVWAIPHP